ncbi:hypothetical protein Anapl_05668 [Anas platyrhynchos]|uniref:Uncharacterized protein n=1 Tax=Anas platyrhynchos TaxID=8839 RepID=R0L325_ANAPL|nr:hypothetical protein Anapl_05668 [Anas platyrhynchos]
MHRDCAHSGVFDSRVAKRQYSLLEKEYVLQSPGMAAFFFSPEDNDLGLATFKVCMSRNDLSASNQADNAQAFGNGCAGCQARVGPSFPTRNVIARLRGTMHNVHALSSSKLSKSNVEFLHSMSQQQFPQDTRNEESKSQIVALIMCEYAQSLILWVVCCVRHLIQEEKQADGALGSMEKLLLDLSLMCGKSCLCELSVKFALCWPVAFSPACQGFLAATQVLLQPLQWHVYSSCLQGILDGFEGGM